MSKITAYTALTTVAGGDVLPVVDVSDTSMAATGTTKKITVAKLAAVDWLNAATMYAADPTGAADSTTAINNALAAVPAGGGDVYLPAGTFLLNSASALALATAGTVLRGAGPGATFLKIGASFSAAEAVNVTAASCEVRDLGIVGASSTVTSNPVANGIEITGVARCRAGNLWFQYVNGWAIEVANGVSATTVDTMISRVTGRNCAAGIHLKGTTGSSFLGEHFLTDIQFQQMGAATGGSANLDALLIEDIGDVLVQGVNIGTAGGTTGGAIHVKGACSTVKITNPDVGTNGASGVAPAILIESGANGTPSDVSVANGGTEGGVSCIRVDAGTDITLTAMRAHQAWNTGLVVNGGEVLAIGCSFASNNQSGTTGYDIDASGMSSGNLRVIACRTESTVGVSTAGNVTSPVNSGSHSYFHNCYFIASNNTPSTVFAGGSTPQQILNCVGYNPRGSIAAPSVGASPFTPGANQQPLMIIFSAINGMTQFAIGGTAVAVLPVAGVPYFIGVRQSMTITWAGSAPTWNWFGL